MGNCTVEITVEMMIVSYGKIDDEWKGDILLPATELGYFQKLFGVKSNDPMYHCYFINKKVQPELEKKFGVSLNTELYDYFVEYHTA